MNVRRIYFLIWLNIICIVMGCSISTKGISGTEDQTFVLSSVHSLERAQLEDICKIIKSRMAILDIAGEADVKDDNVIVRIKQNKQIDIEILCKRGERLDSQVALPRDFLLLIKDFLFEHLKLVIIFCAQFPLCEFPIIMISGMSQQIVIILMR